ncbi:MAG TPA: hypothetical protein VL486_00630 [Verrucomicrobiae bacterium]|nr:hypothetical protein [Verrucomicrobiae bacterium]
MKLIQVLSIVLTELSIGTLLMLCLVPPREIRSSFFTFTSLLSAVVTAAALLLAKISLQSDWMAVRFLGLTVIGATAAYGAFRLSRPDLGRVLLITSGFVGFIFGLLPLAEQTLAARGIVTTAPGFFDASVLSGALLLGAATVGMILGHWYLLMRRLSFEHLLRFTQIVLGAVGLRCLVVLATVVLLRDYDPNLARTFIPSLWSIHGNLFFFLMRLLWGLALPLVLGFMVLDCVQRKANQPATGLLYVMEISVLFGELFAAYLTI